MQQAEQLGFDSLILGEPVGKTKKVVSRTKKIKEEYEFSQDMARILFPEDFTSEQHLSILMDNDRIVWCEDDVYYFQRLLLKDAVFILARMNSSLAEIDDCLRWAFTENEDYDFSVDTCLNNLEGGFITVKGYQKSLLDTMCRTHRELKKLNRKSDVKRISFIRKCITKCRNILDMSGEFVKLDSLERVCK